MSRKKEIFSSLLLTWILILSFVAPSPKVFATDASNDPLQRIRNVGDIINSIDFNYKGEKGEVPYLQNGIPKIERWIEFQINIDWDSSKYNGQLQKGDHIELVFPDNIHLTAVPNYDTGIPLEKIVDGVTYNVGSIYLRTEHDTLKHNDGPPLRKISIVFGQDVESLKNLSGTFHILGSFPNTSNVLTNQNNHFPIKISGHNDISKTYYLNYSPNDVSSELICHWEETYLSDRQNRSIGLYTRINIAQIDLQGSTIVSKINSTNAQFDQNQELEFDFQVFNMYGERIGDATPKLIPSKDYRIDHLSNGKEMRIHILSDALNGRSARLILRINYDTGIDYVENHIHIEKNGILLPLSNQEQGPNKVIPKTAEHPFKVLGLSGIKATLNADPNYGHVEMITQDEESNLLNEVTFEILRADTMIERITTSAHGKGKAYSGRLTPGDYQVVQKTVPEGYLLDSTPFSIKIEAGKTVTHTFTIQKDPAQNASLEVLKIDAQDQRPLQNARFELYHDKNKDDKEDGEAIVALTTDDQGQAVFENLEPGRYLLKEIGAPEGYRIASDPYRIDLTPKKKHQIKIENQKIAPSNVPSDPDPSDQTGGQNDPSKTTDPSTNTGSANAGQSGGAPTDPSVSTPSNNGIQNDPDKTTDPSTNSGNDHAGQAIGSTTDPNDPTQSGSVAQTDPSTANGPSTNSGNDNTSTPSDTSYATPDRSPVRPDPVRPAETDQQPISDDLKDPAKNADAASPASNDPDRKENNENNIETPTEDITSSTATNGAISNTQDVIPSRIDNDPSALAGRGNVAENRPDPSEDPESSIANDTIPQANRNKKIRSTQIDRIDRIPKTGHEAEYFRFAALWVTGLTLLRLGFVFFNKKL
ncbi:MAG: SpaA isopeptide-forming pilin-related protein [Peptostreptococcaceae bacterium]|nr:SpaA isopeptide-forming pilin-related protein [Peptostreptococcaceae bacterium]